MKRERNEIEQGDEGSRAGLSILAPQSGPSGQLVKEEVSGSERSSEKRRETK